MLLLKLEGEESALPLAPPRNRSQLETDNDCENPLVSNSALQPASNGLPPTPKVHMGACFSKVSLHQHNQSSIVYLFENNIIKRNFSLFVTKKLTTFAISSDNLLFIS